MSASWRARTDAARREVVLASAVTRLLRERWLTSSCKNAEHLVFCKTNGRERDYRVVGEASTASAPAGRERFEK